MTDDEIEIFKWNTVIEVLLRLRVEQLRGEPGRRPCQPYLICAMVTISIHHGSDPLAATFLHFLISKPSLILATGSIEWVVCMASRGHGLCQKTVGILHVNRYKCAHLYQSIGIQEKLGETYDGPP